MAIFVRAAVSSLPLQVAGLRSRTGAGAVVAQSRPDDHAGWTPEAPRDVATRAQPTCTAWQQRAVSRNTGAPGTMSRTYVVRAEQGFPVETLMSQAAGSVGIQSWRVRPDDRDLRRSGEVEIKVWGSLTQLATFERRWERP